MTSNDRKMIRDLKRWFGKHFTDATYLKIANSHYTLSGYNPTNKTYLLRNKLEFGDKWLSNDEITSFFS